MPHFIVEYTNNVKDDANIPLLLEKVNKILIAKSPVFPTGGIRSRAIELNDYYIADGGEDDAFVHATLKIGAGRPDDIKKATCDEIFATMTDHFSTLYANRYLAISMELFEFSEAGTYKQNNIHARFKK